MRAGSTVSTAVALFALQVHGAPDRRLEGITETGTLMEIESFYGVQLERKFKDLPTSGTIEPAPWNGLTWNATLDSINFPLKSDQASATEKYAEAFGLNATELKAKVSFKFGIYSVDYSVQCTWSCRNVEEVCTVRGDSAVCIPWWASLSDGLALASILEDEPYCPIVYNGVSFDANDIKGLLSAVYAEANVARIIGGLRNHDDAVSFDEYGRPREASYRDVNPGFFHITLANIMGKLKHPLIIDRYPGRGFVDQALSGFEVHEHTSMSPKEATKKFYTGEVYPFNDQATEIIHVRSSVFWNDRPYFYDHSLPMSQKAVLNASYTYLLEINRKKEIIGGEWVNATTLNHPDTIIIPKGKPIVNLVTSVGFSYANVLRLTQLSHACPVNLHRD